MERNGVTSYICGHDHNLQHIRSIAGSGLDYIISAAGGASLYRYIPANKDYIRNQYQMETLFFKMTNGFVTMAITKEQIVYDYFDQDAVLVYSFTRTKLNV